MLKMSSGRMTTEAAKVSQRSVFFQEGGSNPLKKPMYRGEVQLGGFNVPLGDVTPIYLPSSSNSGEWEIIGVTRGARGLATSDVTARVNKLLIPYWSKIKKNRCPVNLIVKVSDCAKPDDINNWDYLVLYVSAYMTDFTEPVVNPITSDDNAPADITGSFTALKEHYIYPVRFETVAGTEIVAEVIDGFYAGTLQCEGDCGEIQEESDVLYTLTVANSGSPGLSSQVVFTVDGKETFNSLDIYTLGGKSASAMVEAGGYLVVVSVNDDAHHIIPLEDANNVDPTQWSRISSSKYAGGLRCIEAHSSEEIYIGGQAGYMYKLEDPTLAPNILLDGTLVSADIIKIRTLGSTVVGITDDASIVVSQNKGDSFSTHTITLKSDGSTVVGTATALGIINANTWIVAVDGNLYITVNGGTDYHLKDLVGNVNIVNDIRFIDSAIGCLVAQLADGNPRVYRTFSSGNLWDFQKSISGVPTAERFNFVTLSGPNEVAIGGRVSTGGDGVLAIGS